mmetsp:Transcript_45860/g.98944  ORF Transcript_45860/g.98944 Transcript_45860/m.98944 type:complete len:308 (-) Transcript_45860:95-1018(-)
MTEVRQATAPTLRQWLKVEEPFDVAMNPSFLGMFAHLGCLGALQQQGLLKNVCGLAGASAGAICGSVLAAGMTILDPEASKPSLHEDLAQFRNIGDRVWDVLDPSVGPGLLVGEGLERELGRFLPENFESLKLPFACTAWSVFAGRTEVLQTGRLASAVRASCSVPGLFQPMSMNRRRWLVDGGVRDPSGSHGLQALPKQPRRSLHVIVNRRMMPGLDNHWTQVVPPSKFGAKREEVVSVRLNNPPNLLLGKSSFEQFVPALEETAAAVLEKLDVPLTAGQEDWHWILEIDVNWKQRSSLRRRQSKL